MQILILSSKFPYPLKDGGAIATYQCYSGLKECAKKVHVLSFNTNKHFICKQDIPEKHFPKGSFTLVNLNTVPTIRNAILNLLFSKKPYILHRFRSNQFAGQLKEILEGGAFDLVQIEGLYMLQYMDVVRNYSNAKIAFRSHNLEHQIWKKLALGKGNFFKKAYLFSLAKRVLRFEKKCLNCYDLLVPISKEDAGYYEQLGNKQPIRIIPTGFDFEGVNYQAALQLRNRVFYIGSLEWMPNQEGLVWFLDNCWPLIKKEIPDIDFFVAGRNSPNWLGKKVVDNGARFMGEVASSAGFMKENEIMVVPLLSGSGMRIKIIEAIINSRAVVSTSTGVKGSEMIHEEHLLVADDPVNFASSVVRLIKNQQLHNKLTRNAFDFAKRNFDNKAISKELYQFYKVNLS